MSGVFPPIGVGLVLLVATVCACGRSTSVATSGPAANEAMVATVEPTATALAELTVPAEATPAVPETGTLLDVGQVVSDRRSIGELSAGLTAAVDSLDYRVGVAVLDLDRDITYQGGDSGVFALASVSKLALAVGVLHRAELEGRELTWRERTQLGLMLSESKNEPAVAVWNELGAVAITEALIAYGIFGFWMPDDQQWGDMASSATDVAMLVRLFVSDNSSLRTDDRLEVLSLMQSVVSEQRWGISAGVDMSRGAETALAIKNGWYPEDEVWRVNSAGAVTVAGQTDYVVVLLSDGASDFPRGVRAIEEIAAAVNRELYPEKLLVALPQFVPLPIGSVSDPTAVGDEVFEEPVDKESEGEPPAAQFVAFDAGGDVLVPSGVLLNSGDLKDSFVIWFEVPESEVEGLLDAYVASMREMGWTELRGPPQLLLSKQHEGRFVAVTALEGALGGTQVIELRIAPVPSPSVGVAAIE